MKSFEFEHWDDGRLIVNRASANILSENGLTSFDSLMNYEGGTVAKNLLRERTTTRIELPDSDGGQQAFYIKRHGPSPWKEHIKPFFRLTRPILGARNEWNAMIRFHEVGIPTMTPVALGEHGKHSFVLTKSIEGCQKLSEWIPNHHSQDAVEPEDDLRQIIDTVADIARTMHDAGMHHQDFYLTHLMVSKAEDDRRTFVIDLGRVQQHRRLSRRWIVKDLAQLNYSASMVNPELRQRFLESYLGRPIAPADRGFVRQIERKSLAIARHSRKNRL